MRRSIRLLGWMDTHGGAVSEEHRQISPVPEQDEKHTFPYVGRSCYRQHPLHVSQEEKLRHSQGEPDSCT